MQVDSFLAIPTPQAWLEFTTGQVEVLLLDHAHCEKKAAQSAMHFIRHYPHYDALVYKASRFAREELRHFEQVYQIMKRRGIQLTYLSASRYAQGMRQHLTKQEPDRLLDMLIISAFIEARSCERFGALIPYLDQQLAKFYRGLLASEQRHFMAYLELAEQLNHPLYDERICFFREVEAQLIVSPDDQFRFHSGVPSPCLLDKKKSELV